LGLATETDGTVIEFALGDESQDGGGGGTSPAPCIDAQYNEQIWLVSGTFNWYFRAGSVPSEVTVDNARTAFRDATGNITQENNDCGWPDRISATSLYKGDTTDVTDVHSDGTCNSIINVDAVNQAEFGPISTSGVLAVTCTVWNLSGYVVDSDARVNTNYTWYVNLGPNCVSKWSVEAVMTHERGHTFGIAHVSESAHGRLTMSTQIDGPCQAQEKTLGAGDMLGLEAYYS